MSRIEAVCFDLDNTLWDAAPVLVAAEHAAFDWLEREAPRVFTIGDREQLRAHRQAFMQRWPQHAHDFTWLRKAWARELLETHGYPGEWTEDCFAAFHEARNTIVPFAEVPAALSRLGGHFPLYALTNGNADLMRTPLAPHFAGALGAADVGYAKPDPRAFHVALDRFGLDPATTLYVGDEPHTDIAGAHAAGMLSAWVDRRSLPWPEGLAAAHWTARDLGHLADLLLAGRDPVTT